MTRSPDAWATAAARMPLAFAQVREDPRLDVELAAGLPPGSTVVMIASGGETAACLGRLPLRLHLVDMNPAQIALARLKWQLAAEGDVASAMEVLGHAELSPEERWQLLGGRLERLHLPVEIFGSEKIVAAVGPDHAGRYELTFAALRERLAPWASLLDEALRSPVPVDLEGSPLGDAMDAAFAEVMTQENLVCLFGEDATQNPRMPFSRHFAERTHLAFRRMPPVTNPFLWQILAGRFPDAAPYDWLGASGGGGIHPDASAEWHHGKMHEVLDSFADGSADIIHLSNILDWLSPEDGRVVLVKAARVLKPAGRVIIRQLNSTLDIPVIESGLVWDAETGRGMEERDRSYFYPQLHIGRKSWVESYLERIPEGATGALEEFEREFTYPLGAGSRFRISHGNDYLKFFRAMGEATLVVAADSGRITGSLARVRRELVLRSKAAAADQTVPCHYLGDLKVRTECRGGSVLARLFRETKRQILASDTHACYGVVMGGTGRLPTDYTGRVGVPAFEKLGDIVILRLAADGQETGPDACRVVDAAGMRAVVERMGVAGYRCGSADQACRSQMEPVHLVAGNGEACGRLEDTRSGKRLFLEAGEEMVSAHFSGFIYRDAEAAGALLVSAVEYARVMDCPAVFCAVPSGRMDQLRPFLGNLQVTEAPASIYGIGLDGEADWWMDTAEI